MAKSADSKKKPLTEEPGNSDIRSFMSIPVNKIVPGSNIRTDFGDLASLTESVTLHGVLEPVIVEAQDDGSYLLLAGGRRYRAALDAGLLVIPAVAYPALSEKDRYEISKGLEDVEDYTQDGNDYTYSGEE